MVLYFDFYIQRFWLLMSIFSARYHKSQEQINSEQSQILTAQKDIRKFTPIYEKYYEPIFLFINKRVLDEELTGELTSRVFYRCIKSLYKYEFNELPFSSWLYKIAHNEVLYYFRTKKNDYRYVSLNDSHIDLLSEEISILKNSEEKGRLVSYLLEQLSEEEVQFLELRFFEERSFAEIGFMLSITANNAKIKTYRVIGKLKNISKNIDPNSF